MFIFIDFRFGGLEGSPDPANAKNMDFVEVSLSSAWDYSEISLMSHGTITFDFYKKVPFLEHFSYSPMGL